MLVSSCDPEIFAPPPSWTIFQYLKCTSREKSKETVFHQTATPLWSNVFIDWPADCSANRRVKSQPVKAIQQIKATCGTVMMAPTAVVHIQSENNNGRILNMLWKHSCNFIIFFISRKASPFFISCSSTSQLLQEVWGVLYEMQYNTQSPCNFRIWTHYFCCGITQSSIFFFHFIIQSTCTHLSVHLSFHLSVKETK